MYMAGVGTERCVMKTKISFTGNGALSGVAQISPRYVHIVRRSTQFWNTNEARKSDCDAIRLVALLVAVDFTFSCCPVWCPETISWRDLRALATPSNY